MIWLAGAAVVMLAIAMVLVFYPLVRTPANVRSDTLSNTQITRQRLQELEHERAQGLLSADDMQSAIDETKIALARESDGEQQTASKPAKGGIVIGMVAVILVALIYWQVNEISAVQHWQKTYQRLPELSNRLMSDSGEALTADDLQDFALGLRTKLAVDGEDPTGWLLLGRLHATSGRLDSALQAYEKGLALTPDHRGMLTSYAQALMMAMQQTGDESYLTKAKPTLNRLLQLQPDDVSALGMLAVTAGLLGERDQALQHWRTLQQLVPAESPMFNQIQQQIAQLGGAPPAVYEAGETRLKVAITISEALKDKVPASGYLFVFAQAADGDSRMPAAVVKQPISDLPVEVLLSDEQAMTAGYTLSQLSKVRLVARISSDGNVMPQEGELEGEVTFELDKGESRTKTITIDKELL